MNKYPIYVISKGRWEKPLTSKALTRMGCDFYLVVEPTEKVLYEGIVPNNRLLVLPFSNLKMGSIPARNWVWDHSSSNGDERHWILDDNIEQFNRMNNNLQHKCNTPSYFLAMEEFVDRYENIALAGPEYDFFCKSRCAWPPFRLNTRIYSTILIKNDLPYRWRGKFNEDTDLSIRALKDNYVNVLFLAFTQQKTQTMKMKGGNTDNVYNDGTDRLSFAMSLAEQHPDCVRVTKKFNRWHHHVDYSRFKKNKLKRKAGWNYSGVNNFGMKLVSDIQVTRTGKVQCSCIEFESQVEPDLTNATESKQTNE